MEGHALCLGEGPGEHGGDRSLELRFDHRFDPRVQHHVTHAPLLRAHTQDAHAPRLWQQQHPLESGGKRVVRLAEYRDLAGFVR
eukprot:1158094-Rhodomonas_salina.1